MRSQNYVAPIETGLSPRSIIERLENRCLFSITAFTVDPVRSSLTVSGDIGNSPILEQMPGSLTTSLQGTITADVQPSSFTVMMSSTSVPAVVNGSWLPGSSNPNTPEPADFGGDAALLGSTTPDEFLAARNVIFSAGSNAIPLAPDGTFPVSQLTIFSTSGTVYYAGLSQPGTYSTVNNNPDQATTSGSYTVANGVATVTVPLAGMFVATNIDGFPVTLNFAGQIVATANIVPPPPVVTGVSIGSTSWSSTFTYASGYPIPTGPAQLNDLPWTNLNQVNITFNEPVTVAENDLTVAGVINSSYSFSGFSYNATTNTATWTFASAIPDDKIRLDLLGTGNTAVTGAGGLALDGEWNNGVSAFPSGNGVAGGDFVFQINVLPGDTNQNGGVNVSDTIQTRNRQGSSVSNPTNYSPFNDVNGDGGINVSDTILVRNRQGTTLPAGNPVAPNLTRSGNFSSDAPVAASNQDVVTSLSLPHPFFNAQAYPFSATGTNNTDRLMDRVADFVVSLPL